MSGTKETGAESHGNATGRDPVPSQPWTTSSTLFFDPGTMGGTKTLGAGGFREELERDSASTHAQLTSKYTSTSQVVEGGTIYESGRFGDDVERSVQFFHTQSASSGSFATSKVTRETYGTSTSEITERNFVSSSMQSASPEVARVIEGEGTFGDEGFDEYLGKASVTSKAQDTSSNPLFASGVTQEAFGTDRTETLNRNTISYAQPTSVNFSFTSRATEEGGNHGAQGFEKGRGDGYLHTQTASSDLLPTASHTRGGEASSGLAMPHAQTLTPDLVSQEPGNDGTSEAANIIGRTKRDFLISHAEPPSSPSILIAEDNVINVPIEAVDTQRATVNHAPASPQSSPAFPVNILATTEATAMSETDAFDDAVNEEPGPAHANSTPPSEAERPLAFTARRASLNPNEESYLAQFATTEEVARLSSLANISLGEELLNPGGKDFDLYRWLRKIMYMLNQDRLQENATIKFHNLHVSGTRFSLRRQQTVLDVFSSLLRPRETFNLGPKTPKQILWDLNGILNSGELLLVLGRPGSGCSAVARALCGELRGLKLDSGSIIHYSGTSHHEIPKDFQGVMLYNPEVDRHFPHLTVGQTLEFAASVRTPAEQAATRTEYAKAMTKVVMAVFGLSHTYSTKIGSESVRGVSEGDRKRVNIAEIALSGAALAAWDKPTRSLDSAEATKFVQSLRLSADLGSATHVMTAYQANQTAYDLFDRTLLLYEGRQIYYGSATKARGFFERQGWYCPPQLGTADFLTSVTNAAERQPRRGMENKVPRTPDEFAAYWCQSPEYQELQTEMGASQQVAMSNEERPEPKQDKQQKRPFYARSNRAYPSITTQVTLTTKRAFQRAWNERVSAMYKLVGNFIIALIIGSMFYNTPATTSGFFSKGSVLLYIVLLNSFMSLAEISSQHCQRPVVEKHASFGFYQPMVESAAVLLSDIPTKFLLVLINNIVIYFMSNLRREPSQFFICFLFNLVLIIVTSAAFRSTAAVTKTLAQAMALAGALVLPVTVYTGFIIPVPRIHKWFDFIHDINPAYYAYEALVANEFHGRGFDCADLVPSYPILQGNAFICSVVGAVAGRRTVSGDKYIWATYKYTYDHVWRDFGILIAFLVGWMIVYFAAAQFIAFSNVIVDTPLFRRGNEPGFLKHGADQDGDEESGRPSMSANQDTTTNVRDNTLPSNTPRREILTWRDVTYNIDTSGGHHRVLDQVSGWAKSGTITALMSINSVERTTLLEVLAQRTTVGTVSGEVFLNNWSLSSNLQRKIGYVQQQDLHLETATVRETLRFSAMLRQPCSVSKEEKYTYVEEIIKVLDMEEYAEAFVGVFGEGLNTKQRKLLSIGVEMAAMPKLLLLDAPSSGLDAQSINAIYRVLRKLADAGQTIICTVQEPSPTILRELDQVLFLSNEGKTVYFGPVGENGQTLLDYFESHGSHRTCRTDEDPAKYLLETINAATNKRREAWSDIWTRSSAAAIQDELVRIHAHTEAQDDQPDDYQEFATSQFLQLFIVLRRMLQQYWRSPLHTASRIVLNILAALFIGFSFYKPGTSIRGLQETIFSAFMLCTLFAPLVHQITPLLTTNRTLYESRERPSKTYSGFVLLLATLLVELLYQIPLSICFWASYSYAVTGILSPPRQGLLLLFSLQYFISALSFAFLTIPTSALLTALLTFMSFTFNGVMQPPHALPGFWLFMYRVSPFTYFVSGVTATQLHGRDITCSEIELSVFNPPLGQSCGDYLNEYLKTAAGRLLNPAATSDCQYCPLSVADQFLAEREYNWDERWRNFGIGWAFVGFNFGVAVLVYYLVWRVGVLDRLRRRRDV
ncbi:hypothetical protein BO94DRAFT_483800 [Aspergillus sclerotioniger CBS 115572]|uniref:ABC transporter domain-containing protein n=1 Tax=Aspergillus sclerotioniger CBS 115572 TaxID=1450535 RepID=A0A317X9E8_9EURO|nr:hypothetical protein BO94DRAFT_483800 [Aspergillus sclerotioniger CBS 115572]PWY95196.1 hypothetical protein BO94DRAFT_483800 [Aspergillus sclerotioniger CBS 115572]